MLRLGPIGFLRYALVPADLIAAIRGQCDCPANRLFAAGFLSAAGLLNRYGGVHEPPRAECIRRFPRASRPLPECFEMPQCHLLRLSMRSVEGCTAREGKTFSPIVP